MKVSSVLGGGVLQVSGNNQPDKKQWQEASRNVRD